MQEFWNLIVDSTFFYETLKILITAGLAVAGTQLAARYSSRVSDRREKEERQRNAEHLAISVVCALDPLVGVRTRTVPSDTRPLSTKDSYG